MLLGLPELVIWKVPVLVVPILNCAGVSDMVNGHAACADTCQHNNQKKQRTYGLGNFFMVVASLPLHGLEFSTSSTTDITG